MRQAILRTTVYGAAAIFVMGLLLTGVMHAQNLAGNWQGTLEAGTGLRTVLKITSDDGKLKATMYSVDQGGQAIPVTSIALDGTAVAFAIKPLDVTYAGTLTPDGNTIAGKATQNGQTHPLNLSRVTPENTWAIPEPPKPMAPDALPGWDVATVKPTAPDARGKFYGGRGRNVQFMHMNVVDLITIGYGIHKNQIVAGPEWLGDDKFDVQGVPDVEGQPNQKQVKVLAQKILADRFQLKFHHEQKELPVYAVTAPKTGLKITPTQHAPTDPEAFFFRKLGNLTAANLSMQDFAEGMQSAVMDKPVVDHTGLTGRYDFTLNWTADESQFAQMGARVPPPTDDPNAPPNLFTAIQEQLGLKLEATRAKADVIVIDHIEKPSAN